MTTRNLRYMFEPKSLALIGASDKAGAVGAVVMRNIINAGFAGEIFPVNPKYQTIEGIRAYPDIESLPVAPDLAVIITPPATVPGLIAQLGEKGTKAAVVITAGFGEGGSEDGHRLRQQMLDAARPYLLRILGPNCLGLMIPGVFLNASFAHIQALPGRLAFATQSGAIITSVLDWATYRRIGFSHFVSLGDMSDIDFGDMLDYLANDSQTKAILLYIEAITNARKFMSAARAASRMKPVIVVKAGRHAEGAKAAASHTGAMAGSDAVYDAAFVRAGMLRVSTMSALFNAVETLSLYQSVAGDRLTILTNGGGVGVIATDTLIDKKGRLADLSPKTIERLNEVLPKTWSHGNPVDIIGDAPGSRYADALDALFEDDNADAILVLNCPNAVASSTEAAQSVIETVKKKPRSKLLITSWLGEGAASGARQLFSENRIPSYETPDDAVRAFMQMVRYQRSREMLMETPPNIPEIFTPAPKAVQAIISNALSEGRQWLSEFEAKAVLSAYQIPVSDTRIVSSPEEAEAAAAEMNQTVVLKILSPDITHKSDVGGVALNLQTPALVKKSALMMLERIRQYRPDAKIEGFTIQPMIRRKNARELIVGVTDDIQFGPVILFGHGGTAVEVIGDNALTLPPLNMHLAREVMKRTRVYRLLEKYRDVPAADMDAIALTLVKVSQLICDIADIAELDINPLFADENGVIALDARIRVAKSQVPAAQRLAIRPYPKELEEMITAPGGQRFLIRPIKPEDEPALLTLFSELTPEEIRMRFLYYMKFMPHQMAARLTQIDYNRQMALVLSDPPGRGTDKIYGIVNISADPNNETAECAILVRGDLTGMGLGALLMERIINYSKICGIREIYGELLTENEAMLKLSRSFGFEVSDVPDHPGVRRITLKLNRDV